MTKYVLLLIAAVNLFADTVDTFQTRTTVQALSGSDFDIYDSGLVSGPTTGDVVTSNCIVYGCTNAEASGTAFPGGLSASALAVGMQQSLAGVIYAAATAQVSFNDFITLSGQGISDGTPVDVLLTQTLIGTANGQQLSDNQNYNYFGTITSNFGGTEIETCVGSPGNDLASCNTALTTNVLHLSTGTMYPLSAQLTATATATGSASVLMFYGDTARYYLEPLVPGVFIQSASGYSYQAAPEPATASGIAVGFFAILFFALERGRPDKTGHYRCGLNRTGDSVQT